MVWRRKRRDRDWDDIFEEFFGREFDIFDEIFERIMRDFEEMFRRFEKEGEIRPIIRGFSIRIGPDGKPEIKEFGTKPEIRDINSVCNSSSNLQLRDARSWFLHSTKG